MTDELERLRKRVARLPKICGGSGFATLGMGCGGKFEEWEDAFLCVDCKTPYHQRCLLKTCASKYEKSLVAALEKIAACCTCTELCTCSDFARETAKAALKPQP
jgi:hypothetical protein